MGEIVLTNKQVRAIQLIQLEMLIEVDRICNKCNIKYNIIAGTLLGSVRHKGFIPWDDDADVALFRDEYEKFREACKTELDTERFYFQDHRETDGYRWGYGKLRRKGTCFLRHNQEHMPYEQGIFIDIFPLDGVPDFYPLRAVHNLTCYVTRKILWSPVGKVANQNLLAKITYQFLSMIPEEKIFGFYKNLIKFSNQKKTRFVRILTFPTPNIVFGYRRKWYMHSAEYEFEGIIFKGISDYDQYLKFKFGNYMELPPESERKTHPVSKLKLI